MFSVFFFSFRLLQVSMTTSRSSSQLFSSMASKHVTHVIVDMITLHVSTQIPQNNYCHPFCIHMKNSCLRFTTDSKRYTQQLYNCSEMISLFTVREIKLLCCCSAFESRLAKNVRVFPFVCWSCCCQLQGNPFS